MRIEDPDNYYNVIAIDVAKSNNMSLRQVNRYFTNLSLLKEIIEMQNISFGVELDNYVKSVFIQIAIALRIIDKEKYNLFIEGRGDSELEYYYKASPMIKLFVNEDMEKNRSTIIEPYASDPELLLTYRYDELFKKSTENSQNRELFMKAISSIGFSTIIDEEKVDGEQ